MLRLASRIHAPRSLLTCAFSSASSLDATYFSRLTSLLPVEIRQTDRKGRGIFATQKFTAGTVLFHETPFLLSPRFDSVSSDHVHTADCRHGHHHSLSRCFICLAPCPPQSFCCSEACLSQSSVRYAGVLGEGSAALIDYCRHSDQIFPILALLVAGRVIADLRTSKSVANSWGHLQRLVFPSIPSPPPQWAEEYSLLLQAIPLELKSFLPLEWYMRTVSIFHLNGFSLNMETTSLPSSSTTSSSPQDLVKASALFLVSSYFNHSCVPNVSVDFASSPLHSSSCSSSSPSLFPTISLPSSIPTGVYAKMSLLRDVEVDEELSICYTHDIQGLERKRYLYWNYGFLCDCPACSKWKESEVTAQ
eukprot:GILI01012140.1.p1 GENE.GILI01012140.1~~GILI01012140.1.p1  ORF type:complete len:362 (+),score=32.63 GILI01012140.1:47-1132(+)